MLDSVSDLDLDVVAQQNIPKRSLENGVRVGGWGLGAEAGDKGRYCYYWFNS